MKVKELIELLKDYPDMDVITHTHNHTTGSRDTCRVGIIVFGLMDGSEREAICIGNMDKKNINPPNWFIRKMLTEDIPDEWPELRLR